jgi:hypothetical protein
MTYFERQGHVADKLLVQGFTNRALTTETRMPDLSAESSQPLTHDEPGSRLAMIVIPSFQEQLALSDRSGRMILSSGADPLPRGYRTEMAGKINRGL